MYLLDTDHCVFLLRRHETVCRKFAALTERPAYISIITAGELLFGAHWSSRSQENILETNRFLDSIPILPLTRSTMNRFAELKANLLRRGQRLEDPDRLIAATAIESGLVLVTHNGSHYSRIDGLKAEDWCH